MSREALLWNLELDALERYSIAFYLRSTAWVMPVLPLWWTIDQGVPLSTYLSLMAIGNLVGMIIDIPLSFLSDRWSHSRFYGLGLLFFAAAFAIQLIAQSVPALVLYVLGISLAGAMMSGADSSLLVDLVGSDAYHDVYRRLNRRFYAYTALLFIAGAGLYQIKPGLVMAVQSACLFCSAILILTIHVSGNRADSGHSHQPPRSSSIGGVFKTVASVRRLSAKYGVAMLVTIVVTGYFDGLTQFQNRTIQVLAATIDLRGIEVSAVWVSALLLSIGNIASSLGLGNWLARLNKGRSGLLAAIYLMPLASAAVMFLATQSLFFVVLGYSALCVVKGAYRPITSALVVRLAPKPELLSTWISAMGIGVGLMSAVFNLVFAQYGPTVVENELLWACAGICLCVASFGVACRITSITLLVSGGRTNKVSKKNIPLDVNTPMTFTQEYASTIDENNVVFLAEHQDEAMLAHPAILGWGPRSITWEYVSGTVASSRNHLSASQMMKSGYRQVVADLLGRRSRKHSYAVCTARGFGKAHQFCVDLCTCQSFAHGDLHPGNVIFQDERYYAIDWDNAHYCCRLFDELTFTVHPWCGGGEDDLQVMLQSVKCLVAEHETECGVRSRDPVEIIMRFARCKLEDIALWRSDQERADLIEGYSGILRRISS